MTGIPRRPLLLAAATVTLALAATSPAAAAPTDPPQTPLDLSDQTAADSAPDLTAATRGHRLVYTMQGREAQTRNDLLIYQTPASVNGQLRATDTDNGDLSKPTLDSNVRSMGDRGAVDGVALELRSRVARYAVPGGTKRGWTQARLESTYDVRPPYRMQTRVRFSPTAGAKASVMMWPKQGWPWEIDVAEVFGGIRGDTNARRDVARTVLHTDVNGDGQANENDSSPDARIKRDQYNTYDLLVTADRLTTWVNGQVLFTTTDRRWIPRGPGHFTVGLANQWTRRQGTPLSATPQRVLVDYVKLWKP